MSESQPTPSGRVRRAAKGGKLGAAKSLGAPARLPSFVPAIVTRLCRSRVLVADWLDGVGLAEVQQGPEVNRNCMAEILLRFYLGSL
ncbi:MAG TPA: hypothetical protein VHW96_23075 [Solirubrobacteraceae bacterium]|jgi:hypothetical protein|nr:hypothetical protein [Solirubrobacteraceae bacterium]